MCRTETLCVCVCFRDLLHELEKCLADPVAIAECFVSKVKIHSRAKAEFEFAPDYTNKQRS